SPTTAVTSSPPCTVRVRCSWRCTPTPARESGRACRTSTSPASRSSSWTMVRHERVSRSGYPSMSATAAGFVPPPYPHDRLAELKDVASAVPGGLVDCSVGTPVDPMADVAVRALVDAAAGATGYPATIGSASYREAAAAWIARRFGCDVVPDAIVAC